MAKDYYAILGVNKGASEKEIKAAYRKLARRHHPDVNPGNKQAEEQFKEINLAYEVLSDPEKRKKYDQYGENWQQAEAFEQAQREAASRGGFRTYRTGPGGFERRTFEEVPDLGDFGGLFEGLFGGRRAGTRTRPRPQPGQDVEYPVEITLEEAFAGTTRLIETQAMDTCPTCNGAGEVVGKGACPTCHGTGVVTRPKRLEVKIPAGVTDGSRVRVAGEGGMGFAGGPRGDLFLVTAVRPHDVFKRQGDDLLVEVPVNLLDAVLGGETAVTTLKGGKLALKIPPETQNGCVFRLTGQGMPHLGSSGRGDLLAKVRVLLPTSLSPRERALFEDLRTASTGSKRGQG